jgi:hypothetical protein
MLKDKHIWISLITSVIVVIIVFSYLTKAATITNTVSGYLILMDQRVSSSDYGVLGIKNFESVVYLPSGNGKGTVTSCSFNFPSGIDGTADITKDGRIDAADVYISIMSFLCNKDNTCWEKPFMIEECYFTYSDHQFKDPTRDCKIDMSDINLAINCFQNKTSPFSTSCETNECCRADVNNDGIVDVADISIIATNNNTYASVYKNYGFVKRKNIDINNDGIVDVADISIIAENYGYAATEQTCKNDPLEHVSGNEWRVRTSGRGLYYIGVSYIVTV